MPRNASGVYTLPAGNPVISGTIISSTWANDTMSDLANEMTSSLSRSGDGGMLAPLLLVNGTSASPALSWTNDDTSGWYRAAANDFRFSVLNTDWMVLNGSVVQVRNTTTGAGLERVLTTSDGGLITPDSYNYSSAVVTAPNTGGLRALAIGDAAQAMVDDAISIGTGAETFSDSAVAIGPGAYAPAPNALAYGHDAQAGSAGAIAIGFTVSGSGNDSITVGNGSASSAGNVITVGLNATTTAPDSVTVGNGATTNGPDSVTIGTGATTTSQGAVGIGEAANVIATDSIAIGAHTNAGGNSSVAIGPHADVGGGFADALVLKAGPNVISAPGSDSITIATSPTNYTQFYQGKFRLNNADAQYIVPEHADATLLAGETGSFVLETAAGLRYYDGAAWQTLLTASGASGLVTLGTAQTITAEKTFTDTQRFRWGDTSEPTVSIGADVGASTVTDATTKRALITAPAYNSGADPEVQIFDYSASGAATALEIGGGGSVSFGSVDVLRWRAGGSVQMGLDTARFNIEVPLELPAYDVASVPAGSAQRLIFVTNGDAGAACLAVHDGSSWRRISLGATISAT